MPSRNRAREAAANQKVQKTKKAQKNTKKKPRKKTKKGAEAGRARTGPMLDPSAVADAHTRFVQPYEATKTYICPGCNRDIPPGLGHLVAVPPDDPDLRRHWHRGCWANRHTRF